MQKVDIFARKHPWRFLLADMLACEQFITRSLNYHVALLIIPTGKREIRSQKFYLHFALAITLLGICDQNQEIVI